MKTILGKIYVGDNENVLFVLNDGVSQIVLMNGECDSKVLVSDDGSEKKLNFNEHHQIYGIYRLRRGCEKTIYFTDNYNPPRYLNISDVNSFKEMVVQEGIDLIEYGALDPDKMLLQKVYDKIPKIVLKIGDNGQLLSGSYNIAVRYVDEDLNPSEWIYATEPIMIWQSTSDKYSEVRASTNEDVEYRKYGPTNKSIKVSVRNQDCDHSYMFVQFAMICATSGTGIVNDVVYSPLLELNFNKQGEEYDDVDITYNFTGGSDVMTGSEDEILANTEIYDRVKCLEQADNRLVMGNVTDMDVDWCKLQKYASRIVADCVTKEVSLTDYTEDDNPKNPMVLYNNGVGYQPGEIYSFGIVYVFENGVKSPVYHIPGRSGKEHANYTLCGGDMAMQQDILDSSGNVVTRVNSCENAKYSQVSMACEGFRYWGADSIGDNLDGEHVRHHRFPYKTIGMYNETNTNQENKYIYHYNLYVGKIKNTVIRGKFKRNCDYIYIKYDLTDSQNNLTDEEFELEVLLKDLDSSKRTLFAGFNCDRDNNGHFNHFTEEYTRSGSPNTNHPYIEFAKRKYKKIKDIYVSENKFVKFKYLQEYPQLVKTDAGPFSFSTWVTTGGSMTAQFTRDQKAAIWSLAAGLSISPIAGTPTMIAPIMALYLKYKEDGNAFLEAYPERNFKNDVALIAHFEDNYLKSRLVKVKFTDAEKDDYDINNDIEYNTGNELHFNTNITFRIERTCENISNRLYERKDTILGIKFGNIDIPDEKYLNGHKVVGYYIVQNERTKDDMTVLDSAVLTPMFQEKERDNNDLNHKTITSGRIFVSDERQNGHFPINEAYDLFDKYKSNGSSPIDTFLVEKYISPYSVGFINTRFKFNKEELYFKRFRNIGYFELEDTRLGDNELRKIPSCYSTNCDDLWITEDVQAGSSYNKKINSKKDKDDDGFDLHVYHKDSIVRFVPKTASLYDIDRDSIHYLVPSSSINEELYYGNKKEIFNASCDNNTGIIFDQNNPFRNDIATLFGCENKKITRLPYGYLERDLDDYYPDFGNRPYFIASDLILFNVSGKEEEYENEDKKRVFRGDCFTSAMKYTTSMLYDIRMKKRGKKNTVWMYIVGALGVAGGVVGSIWTGGATMALVGPSISLIQNGIRTDVAFNTMKKFNDFGGKKALTDFWAKNLIDVEQDDDEIQWLCESVDGLFFESNLNINWRVGTSISDITDYLDPLSGYNPSELRQYFQKKLTYADKEHKDGRMYRGFAMAEIYDINKDFQRRNMQKMYYCIPITHKCCSECENRFPKRIVYSQQSFAEERTDNYKVFLPGNYKDIDGETGDVTNIVYNGQDAFMVFTEEGLWQLAPQRQQQANPVTQVVSFIGTGDFFAGQPQRITKNDTNISFGSRHQSSFINTPMGMFWYSEHDNAVYTFAKNMPVDIFKQGGMGKWFERNGRLLTDSEWYKQFRTVYPFKDNPSSDLGTGYVMGWDNKYERLLITKKDNRSSFSSECFYDADERQKHIVKERVEYLHNIGAKNICFHWDKERCCYVIDYDTDESVEGTIVYNEDGSAVEKKQTNTVLYIGNIEYYEDENRKTECKIRNIVTSTIRNSINGNLLIVSDKKTYSQIAKYYDNAPMFYDTDNGNFTNGMYDFVRSDWSSYFTNDIDNLSYIAIVSDFSSFNAADNEVAISKINSLMKTHGNFNFTVIPILQNEYDDFNYSSLTSYLASFSPAKTFNDYDTSFISDEFCYVTDKIVLGNIRQYSNNVSDYISLLQDLKEQISNTINYINDDNFSVDKFDSVVELISLLNTYNHWNLLKNAYDFVNYDLFGNGNKNLIMFKDTSDEFNSFALNLLGSDWYDMTADYNALATGMTNCTNTVIDSIEGLDNAAKIATYTTDLFNKIYKEYVEHKKSMVYNESVSGNNVNTLKNICVMLSHNKNSLVIGDDSNFVGRNDYAKIEAYAKENLPFGDKCILPINVNTDVYIEDFINNKVINNLSDNMIVSASTHGQETNSYIVQSNTKHTSVRHYKQYVDNREYVGNHEPLVDDMEKLDDNSFTISYKPGLGFVSFHSYLPSLYVYTPDSFHTWRVFDEYLYRHNIDGEYQKFYGDIYPFVVESVDKNPNIAYGPQIVDSISILANADRFINGNFTEDRNTFFDHAYFYNNRQSSLFSEIVAKGTLTDEDYFDDYLGNEASVDVISAEKRESLWHINGFRDFRVDYDATIHLTDNDSRENFMDNHNMNGWIDKALNEDVLDSQKDWWDLEPFRDNFMCQRYFYTPKENNNIRLRVMLATTAKAQSNDNTLK